MLPHRFSADNGEDADSCHGRQARKSVASDMPSAPTVESASIPRRASETVQRTTRELFRRPSQPFWSLSPAGSKKDSASSSPSLPRDEKFNSLHFSISSFGDWLSTTSLNASPLTTPDDLQFRGSYMEAVDEPDAPSLALPGPTMDESVVVTPQIAPSDTERLKVEAESNGADEDPIACNASKAHTSLSQRCENRDGSLRESVGKSTGSKKSRADSSSANHPYASRVVGLKTEPSWLLRPADSAKAATDTIGSETLSEILSISVPRPAPRGPGSTKIGPVGAEEKAFRTSASSVSESEYGHVNHVYTYGAAAKARQSRKASVSSTLSFNFDDEFELQAVEQRPSSTASSLGSAFALGRESLPFVDSRHAKSGSVEALSPTSEPLRNDTARRARIIAEIVSTEETYTKGLEELVDIYINPGTGTDGTAQSPIPVAERRQVFINIEAILEFHRSALLPALRSATAGMRDRCENDVEVGEGEELCALTIKVAEDIANIFERHAAFFRMYTSYINNLDAAQRRIQTWQCEASPSVIRTRFGGGRLSAGTLATPREARNSVASNSTAGSASSASFLESAPNHKLGQGMFGRRGSGQQDESLPSKERKRIRAFLQRARSHPRHSQISLESYLLLPVQRIPRYRLLLEELVRFCPPERLREADAIDRALDSISDIATSMNESKRQSEMDRRLLGWQEQIRGHFPSPLVQPHRKLIKDGTLMLQRLTPCAVPGARKSSLGSRRSLHSRCSSSVGRQSRASPGPMLVPPLPAPADSADPGIGCFDFDPCGKVLLRSPRPSIEDSVARSVEVLLCNDILVIVENTSAGSPTSRTERNAAQQSSTGRHMDLVLVMRACTDITVLNGSTLRIADSTHVVHLQASSVDEAAAWQEALETFAESARYSSASLCPSGMPAPADMIASRSAQQAGSKEAIARPLRQVKSFSILSRARGSIF